MLRSLKLTSLGALRSLGLFHAVGRSRWRTQRLLILGYHGVALADESDWNGALFLTEATLRRRFEQIREAGCTVLKLEQAVTQLRLGTLPPRAVVLTFDDGFVDFARLAVPLLQEFGFPATLYLTTHYVEHHYPVFTVSLRYLLWKGRARELVLDGIGSLSGRAALASDAQRGDTDALLRAHADQHDLSTAARDELLATVAARLGIDYDAFRASRILSLLTPTEVASLDPALVSVHLHTHRHRVPVNQALFVRELTDNDAAITRLTPRWAASKHFCYPSGVTHPEFLPWLRTMGIESATTCFSGLADKQTEPLMLPRLLDTTQLTALEFESWLTGVGAMLPRRAQRGEN
jgi:hypothetical protein